STTSADNGAQFKIGRAKRRERVTSSVATLTVNSPPTITSQPVSRTVTAGQTATFSVTATGTAPLNYQWQRGGVPISGATLASYTTPPTTSADNGAQFTVVVSNTAGSVTSSVATLTVSVQRFTLTASKTGTDRGTVASSPAGINCGATCSASYNSGTTVTLTATPDTGSSFTGWSGACSGTGNCNVTLTASTTVTANFADVTAPILSLPGSLITTATRSEEHTSELQSRFD